MTWGMLGAVAGAMGIIVAVHASAYLWLAWTRRRAAASCGSDTDDLTRARTLARLIAAESVATLWLLAAACRPRPRSRDHDARRGAVLIGPAWLPARCLRILAARLQTDQTAVTTWRGRGGGPSALARLASHVESLHQRTQSGGVTILLFGSAARHAGLASAMTAPGVISRVVLLGAPVDGIGASPRNVVCISSRDDAWVQPADRALHPAATNVQLMGVGHLSLLVASHVATLVQEACDPDAAAA